jgi:hypothetical protein
MADDFKITRKGGAAQSEPRHIGRYIDQERPAPQPAGPKSIAGKIEREANRRQNPSQ